MTLAVPPFRLAALVVLAAVLGGCVPARFALTPLDRENVSERFDWASLEADKVAVLPAAHDGQILPSWEELDGVPHRLAELLEAKRLRGAVAVAHDVKAVALRRALHSYATTGRIPAAELRALGDDLGARYVVVFRPLSYRERRWREECVYRPLGPPRQETCLQEYRYYLEGTVDGVLTVFDTEQVAILWEGVATRSRPGGPKKGIVTYGPWPAPPAFGALLDDLLRNLVGQMPPA